jgi:glycosyltransferase involved in cell wall biosynthesis
LAKEFEVGLVVPKKWLAMGRTLHIDDWTKRPEPLQKVRVFGITTLFLGNGGKYFYNPFSLFWTFLKFRPDIVYVEEELWTPSAFQLVFFARLFRTKRKAIFTWENLELPLAWWQNKIKRSVLSSVDTVICGNSEAKGLVDVYLKQVGLKAKMFVNPQFGVDVTHFKPGRKDRILQRRIRSFNIGFVGRFVESKGIDTLIEALSLLPEDCRLLLVSTTRLTQQFKSLAEKYGVSKRIKVIEGKPHQELPKYLKEMDVLVLPSKTTPTWKEQFGRVLIEAMACKVPVIGSSSGAIPEVIGKAGLIFEEKNAKDLAEKILSLKKRPELLKSLGEAGYSRVKRKFTHEKVVLGLAKLLR